jgi:uncharacterized membrane protein YhiD involved in acid resistance
MNELYQFISNYTEPVTMKTVLLSLLLSFGLAQAIAATYVWTFRGMSYSRSFVLTIAMGAVIACTLMLAINNSIAAGLGIAGSLAIIRFRTALRDPRDMVFVFASMAAGIASGLRVHLAAVLGTALFCVSVFLLTKAEFGRQRKFDGLLRFQLPIKTAEGAISPILSQHTSHFALVSMREAAQGQMLERAYQVQLPDQEDRAHLLHDLEALPGIQGVSLLLQEPTVEI